MQADSCNSVKREMFMYDQQNLYQSNQIDFARVITEPFEIALVINFITAHDSKTHIVVRDYTLYSFFSTGTWLYPIGTSQKDKFLTSSCLLGQIFVRKI